MPKTTKIKTPVVTVSIVRGKGTPAMRAAWVCLWQGLINEARAQTQSEAVNDHDKR